MTVRANPKTAELRRLLGVQVARLRMGPMGGGGMKLDGAGNPICAGHGCPDGGLAPPHLAPRLGAEKL